MERGNVRLHRRKVVFEMIVKSVKTWKRASTTTLGLICLCSFFLLSRYNSEFPLPSYKSTSPGYVKNEEVVNASDDLQLQFQSEENPRPTWTYKCTEDACIRTPFHETDDDVTPFEVCWLTCGSQGVLWPYPKKLVSKSSETVKFLPENIRLRVESESESVTRYVKDAFELKKKYLENYPGLKQREKKGFLWFYTPETLGYNIEVVVRVAQPKEIFIVGSTDESYDLQIAVKENAERPTLTVLISGPTFFGVRHGIETFSQLIGLDPIENCLQIVDSFSASDAPSFPYRGILIDSARNFLPIWSIKQVIDAMSYNKLNILHWHLTDSNTFPFHSKRVPQLTQFGALPGQIYYPHEISELVEYARIRGVKIIPELDAPSHAGNGWQFGEKYGLGTLAFYVNEYGKSWTKLCGQPPCGILNPININTYNVLEKVYADMMDLFDKDMFHMGGDEVNLDSWSSISELQEWSEKKNGIELWKFFQEEALRRLKTHSPNVTAILWTSKLTANELKTPFLGTKDYVIQVWDKLNSQEVKGLLRRGFSVILSFVDALYLDWGCGTWLGRNHDWPYHNWQKIYDVKFDDSNVNQILGGEAPLWGEKVGPDSLSVKLWPRAAALAEKLWTNPDSREESVYTRLNYHTYRLTQRGIPVSQLQPESCLHFNGHCRNPTDAI